MFSLHDFKDFEAKLQLERFPRIRALHVLCSVRYDFDDSSLLAHSLDHCTPYSCVLGMEMLKTRAKDSSTSSLICIWIDTECCLSLLIPCNIGQIYFSMLT